jgi:hypothetical protein
MASDWRTSSYTGGQGNCVEVADAARTVIVRDTKDQNGAVLAIPANAWNQFTNSLQPGMPFIVSRGRRKHAGTGGSMTNRMRCPAVAAGILATLLVAGCSTQAVAGSRTARGGAASAGRPTGASPGRAGPCQSAGRMAWA